MAFRKEIFQGLRGKHKNVPKDILNKVADHIEKGVNEESEVDTAVDDADGLVTSMATLFQSETDRRVADALAKKGVKPDAKDTDDDDTDPDKSKKGDDQTPAWAKAIIDQNKALSDKITALEQGKTTDSRKQALEKALADAPEVFKSKILKDFSRMSFENEETFNEYLDETGTDLEAFKQDLSNKGLDQQSKPLMGESNKNGISSNVQAYIDAKTKPDATGGDLGGKKI